MAEEENQTSAYNEAGLQIQRLHNLWLNAEHYALSRRFGKWKNTLESIERELYSDLLKLKTKDSIMKELSLLKIQFGKDMKLIGVTAFGLRDRRSNPNPALRTLDKIHKILKQIQEGSGKGAIYRDADDEDFE